MLSLQLAVLGQIVNISRGGLAFRYVASQDRSRSLAWLNILLTDGSFSLKKLPVRPVWDSPFPRDYAFGLITVRYCGMRYDDLTGDQRSDLGFFIEHFSAIKPSFPASVSQG